jgi:N-acetylglutamate synthase
MPEPRNPRVEDLERAAALHWQAPETEPLGEWRLRAGAGFTGRANSALPLGDPGLPLPEAVTAVEDWYRRRDLRPMIVLGAAPGRDGQRPGPRALPAMRLPRLASIPLRNCAISETRPFDAWGDCGFSLRL